MTFISSLRRLFDSEWMPPDRAGMNVSAAYVGDSEDVKIAPTPQGRRAKLGSPAAIIQMETVGQKVLNAWLQNQHQTMFPLVVNFRNIDQASAVAIARLMAVATLAGGAGTGSSAHEAERWLKNVGADDAILDVYRSGLAVPMPLSEALEAVIKSGAASLAYVAAIVATRRRQRADEVFVDYVATRLELSSETIRSADRRYRA